MSRREEVDLAIGKNEEKLTDPDGGCYDIDAPMDVFDAIEANRELAESLSDEVDARDAIIDKLLAMLEPGEEPNDYQFSFNLYPDRDFRAAHDKWAGRSELHARACEIAGRKE